MWPVAELECFRNLEGLAFCKLGGSGNKLTYWGLCCVWTSFKTGAWFAKLGCALFAQGTTTLVVTNRRASSSFGNKLYSLLAPCSLKGVPRNLKLPLVTLVWPHSLFTLCWSWWRSKQLAQFFFFFFALVWKLSFGSLRALPNNTISASVLESWLCPN